MALILSRIATITRQIETLEDLYQASNSEREKASLEREMSKLTTEYLNLSAKLG